MSVSSIKNGLRLKIEIGKIKKGGKYGKNI